MKINILILGLYIGLMVGFVWADVGKASENCHAITSWYLPFLMFGILSFPALYGYMIGKEEGES